MAATMAFYPVRDDIFDEAEHSFTHQFYQAVGDDRAGEVLVLSSNSALNVAARRSPAHSARMSIPKLKMGHAVSPGKRGLCAQPD